MEVIAVVVIIVTTIITKIIVLLGLSNKQKKIQLNLAKQNSNSKTNVLVHFSGKVKTLMGFRHSRVSVFKSRPECVSSSAFFILGSIPGRIFSSSSNTAFRISPLLPLQLEQLWDKQSFSVPIIAVQSRA